jgi:hypothetical protein
MISFHALSPVYAEASVIPWLIHCWSCLWTRACTSVAPTWPSWDQNTHCKRAISSCFARCKGLLRQEFLPAFLNCFLCMSQSEFSDMVTLHMSIWKSKKNNSIHNNVSRAWFHFMFKHKKERYSTEMHRSTWLAPTPRTSCLIRGTDNQHTYKFVRKCWHARKCTIGRDQEP